MTAVTSTTAGQKVTTADSRASLSKTYDQFLKLLVTQMQNQDPLNPTDSNQFTQQLVAFSGVEQQISANDKLSQLVSAQGSGQTQSALGFIGLEVERQGSSFALGSSPVSLGYNLGATASRTDILVKNDKGSSVRVLSGANTAGMNRFSFDGKDSSGNALAPGKYSFEVRSIDGAGQPVVATSYAPLKIDGIETDNGQVMLVGGDEKLDIGAVTAARKPI